MFWYSQNHTKKKKLQKCYSNFSFRALFANFMIMANWRWQKIICLLDFKLPKSISWCLFHLQPEAAYFAMFLNLNNLPIFYNVWFKRVFYMFSPYCSKKMSKEKIIREQNIFMIFAFPSSTIEVPPS